MAIYIDATAQQLEEVHRKMSKDLRFYSRRYGGYTLYLHIETNASIQPTQNLIQTHSGLIRDPVLQMLLQVVEPIHYTRDGDDVAGEHPISELLKEI